MFLCFYALYFPPFVSLFGSFFLYYLYSFLWCFLSRVVYLFDFSLLLSETKKNYLLVSVPTSYIGSVLAVSTRY
jgi:hypothetical protein